MADDSYTFYLSPAIWNYKNGDRINRAAITRNEYDRNIIINRHSAIIKFKGKKTYFVHSNINNYNTWHNKNASHKNLSLVYKYFKIHEALRIQHKLFKDVDERIVNKKRLLGIPKLNSVPEINTYNHYNEITLYCCSQSCQQITAKPIFKSKFVNNIISNSSNIKDSYHCSHPFSKSCWKVYRCQFNTQEESCCCSCNSDAMFEVMKSLYDCYKKKNCDNCNCILCGHLPREERRLGKLRKSGVDLASVGVVKKHKVAIASEKAKVKATPTPKAEIQVPSEKLRKAKTAGFLTPLEGKRPEQREKKLRVLAMQGIPLPEAKTASEKKLIDKVRANVGLPPEPKTPSAKEKYNKAMIAGLISPLEGKSAAKKEDILRGQVKMGLPLPEGRTASEKALIAKVRVTAPSEAEIQVPPEKLRKAKAAGLLTPLEGKAPEQKEKVLRGLAMQGIPLPEAKTASEKKLIDKVRADVGLPPEPKTPFAKEKYNIAMAAGLITPLEGKSVARKEDILRGQAKMGLPLPEGRTPSEKALIAKVRASLPAEAEVRVPSEKLRKAKTAELLTSLEGKAPEQKEKNLRGLAMHGIPLPEAKTASEKKLIDKVRADVGLPPEPKTPSAKEKYNRAMSAGLITPLEGKSSSRKEDILRGQAKIGLPLPEGRTPSEKALLAKVRVMVPPLVGSPESIKRITGRPALSPEKIKKLDKKTAMIMKDAKGPSDACICDLLIPDSKRSLIKTVKEPTKQDSPSYKAPSEKVRRAKSTGLLTPLKGKKPEQKEKILRGLAMQGVPLPDAKTASEKKLLDKVRADVGLPPEPKTPSAKEKYNRAIAAGFITPLEGKSAARKEDILRGQATMGLPLPEGRTASEQALIAKVRATLPPEAEMRVPSEKLRKAKAAGLLTPLQGKRPEQRENFLRGLAMQGIPLPEAKTASEKKLIDKVRADVGLPPEPKTSSAKEKYNNAMVAGLITPLDGKSAVRKEDILRRQAKMGLLLPEGRTPSEKALIAKVKATTPLETKVRVSSKKLREAKAAGLLTPLKGKAPKQKEKILRGLAMHGIPLPEAKTASEKKLIDKVRADVGLPPEPKTPSAKEKYNRAMSAGLITPLEGKSSSRKEDILRGQAKIGLPLPEGRTPSEKALLAKVREAAPPLVGSPESIKRIMRRPALSPEKIKKLDKKTAMIMKDAKGPSDDCICDLLIPDSKRSLIKTVKEPTKQDSPSYKAPSEKVRRAKSTGLLTPLKGKKPEQKEKILRGLAMQGVPLPDAKTASEKKLIDKVRADVGLPPEPKTPSAKEKYNRAIAAGFITPLEGKSAARKEDILRGQATMGLPLPEGRTASEKALIAKVRATLPPEAEMQVPSEKLRKAKAAGLLTPLQGKRPEQREKILRGLALQGIPLPKAKTASEKKLIDKVRADVGLPPEPKTPSAKEKYNSAIAAGLITPLEGKSVAKKEDILRGLAKMGLPLPEGRTASEQALIAKVRATLPPEAEMRVPSEKLRKAKAAGLLTPLQGKRPEQREKFLRGLALQGIPLPKAKTASEKKLIDKVRADVGLPPEPKTPSAKEKYSSAMAAGLITPLEGKTAARKEDILRGQAKMGLPLTEGRTSSEKALIAKVRAIFPLEPEFLPLKKTVVAGHQALAPEKLKKLDKKTAKIIKEKKGPSEECICDLLTLETERDITGISVSKPPLKTIVPIHKISSEKLRKTKVEELLTPLEGKKPEEKEKILKKLTLKGIPLPEAKTASEKKIIDKVRIGVGLPPVPKQPAAKKKYDKALADGIITPLEGKSTARKKEILRSQAKRGLSLPQGRTPSEKAIIAKVKASVSPEKEISLKTDYGLPVKATTPFEKELVKTAKAEGLLTPLKGKTSMQKEKTLRQLADAGLPLPEGATPSEKALVQKVRTMTGLPTVLTPSENRRKIKIKSKKVGIVPLSKSAKGVRVAKLKGGITEEFQDIIKTTTCDRGCGCDKKKIRFKHSYVKIRVTSPDISSLCPCPEECIPGVKGGVFTDNEGIKVTIGRITNITSFTPKKIPKFLNMNGTFSDPHCRVLSRNMNNEINYYSPSFVYSSDIISNKSFLSLDSGLQLNANDTSNFDVNNNIIFIKSFVDTYENSRTSSSVSNGKFDKSDTSINSNLGSVDLLKTDSSISLITSSSSYSIISFSLAETSSYSEHCMQENFLRQNKYYKMKNQSTGSTYFNPKNLVFDVASYYSTTNCRSSKILTSFKEKYDRDVTILQTGPSEANNFQFLRTPNRHLPVIFVKDCRSHAELFETTYRLLQKSILYDSSSLVIMMSTSSEECDGSYSLESLDSNDYIQVSENHTNRIHKLNGLHNSYQNNKGFRLVTRGKHLEKDLSLVEVFNRGKNENINHTIQEKCDKYCQVCKNMKRCQIISTDTTQDRPCCCPAKQNGTKYKRLENYISEIVTPMILTEAVEQGLRNETYMNHNENKSISHMSFNKLHSCNQTPVRLCKVPLCSGHAGCYHQPPSIPKDCFINDVNLTKPCSCNIDKRQFIKRITKEMRSIGCGKSEENLSGKLAKPLRSAVKLPCEPVNSTKKHCITCRPPQVQDVESMSCLCKVKAIKTKGKNICPCQHKKPSWSQADTIKHSYSDKSGAFSNVAHQCKDKRGHKKYKNAICECSEELEPQFSFDVRDWIDEAQLGKMKSNLTQTVSGFKLNIPRKKPESDKSFEEILKQFVENINENNLFEYDSKTCSCNEKSQINQYASVECVCPYEAPRPDEESPSAEEPFQGIKFHIGGKGSDSKGLSGILCFELLQKLVLSNSNLNL